MVGDDRHAVPTVRRASTGSEMTPTHQMEFYDLSQDEVYPTPRRKRLSDSGIRVSFSQFVDEEPPRSLRTPEREQERAWSDDEHASTTSASPARSQRSPGTPTKRRKVVHWTRQEEQFVIQGVKKYGLGQWRKILEDGHDVFHPHRTNVDLKDKWKNLVRKVPLTAEEEQHVDQRIWRETVAARTIGRMLPTLLQQVDDNDTANLNEDDDGDASTRAKRRRLSQSNTHNMQLFIGTDDTAPHLRMVTIVPRDCPTISVLKRVLSRKLLDAIPFPTNLQLVSIQTRRLLGDFESVEDCANRDGHELYLLYDP